ncbi:MAG: hypothetical protein J6A28_03490 [Clostridia bacterium]|nr:hypothetical protein [Clostridia bacterium]
MSENESYIKFGISSCGWTPVIVPGRGGFTYRNDADGHLMEHTFRTVNTFINNMARVRTFDEIGPNETYVTVDEKLLEMRFTKAMPFEENKSETYAFVNDEAYRVTNTGYVYKKIEFLHQLAYKVLRKPTYGMLPVEMNDGSGQTFINLSDGKIMKERFEAVDNFREHPDLLSVMAFVKKHDGELVFIDKEGKFYTKDAIENKAMYFKVYGMLNEAKKEGTYEKTLRWLKKNWELDDEVFFGVDTNDLRQVTDVVCGPLDSEEDYEDLEAKLVRITVLNFGNGLRALAVNGSESEFTIFKGDKKIAQTSTSPIGSFEDSGFFLCRMKDGTCRFMNGDGEYCFDVYGEHADGFYHGFARIHKKDGTFDFMDRTGSPLGLKLSDATGFIYEDGGQLLAEVKFKGSDKWCFINTKGQVVETNIIGVRADLEELEEAGYFDDDEDDDYIE